MGRDFDQANFQSNSPSNMRQDFAETFVEEDEYEKTKSRKFEATKERVSISDVGLRIYYIGLVVMFGFGLYMYETNEDGSNRKRTGLILWIFPVADRALYLLLYSCGCTGI